MNDDLTELKLSIAKIELTVEHMAKSIERLEKMLDLVNTHASQIDALERRVAALESGKNWIIKSIGRIIIAALLGLVLVKTGIPILPK